MQQQSTLNRRAVGAVSALAATFLLALPSSAQDAIAPGFEATATMPVPGFGGMYETLSDGRIFLFDGSTFDLYQSDGTLIATLGTLPAFVYASFARIDPTETFALCGESLNNDVFKVDLAGGGVTTLANVPYNYDLAYDVDSNFALVSTALGGWGFGNDIVRLDLTLGTYTQLAHVDGPSGPVAVDASGALLLGWIDPMGSADTDEVIKWTSAQLAGGTLLSKADAQIITSGLNGPSSIAISPISNHIFVADNDYAVGLSTIYEIHPVSGAHLDMLVDTSNWLTTLEFTVNGGDATFHAYQPQNVSLRYNSTDFAVFTSDIVDLAPKRPTATLTGPSSGPGVMTLTITHAPADAGVIVFFGAMSDVIPEETMLPVGLSFPLFSSLPVNRLRRLPFITPTDASGTATFQYYDPGSLHGTIALQTIVVNSSATIVGSSSYVLN